ncbi:MAG TPA: ABC transporter ATP-binding protein [Candidatus Acidoferrum sp.]|nr:ABC transporter ATP-binding protein [Candidatus Acidoferrum sp.]
MSDTAIKVDKVYKNFLLPHEKNQSLKSLFTGIFRKVDRGAETQHALKDVSFEVKKGEFFGIVGRNGSGKSTLLKMLASIYQPTQGKITTDGRLVPFIELGVGFNSELTGRENVYLNGALLGFSKKEIDAQYNDIVAFAELERFMDQKLKNYSSGMQVRLAFSLATRAEADILLVDEVLAVGDADFQRKCFDYFRSLRRDKKTVIFVSHDMSAVREYCDRAMLIEKSEVVKIGNVNEVATLYTRMFMKEEAGEDDKEKQAGRWGSKKIAIDYVRPELKKISGMKPVRLVCKATAKEDVLEGLVFGFLVKTGTAMHLTGMNTQILHQKIPSLRRGESVTVTWEVPNIFNDGSYFVDVAAHDVSGDVYDWWEDATSFSIFKEERTPYPTTPDIKVSVEK